MNESIGSATSESDELEERWPRDGDLLFIDGSWASDAHIVRDPKERFYRMPMGYMKAGDVLIERAIDDVVDRRNIVYAAVFCYRQSIELFLKHLIEEFPSGRGNRKLTHSLSALWNQFAEIAQERGRDHTIGLPAAEALIKEMDTADKKSDGFRFPADVNGAPFVFGDRGIDLENLREVMHGLQNFFECAYLDFEHQDDTRLIR